MPDIPDLTNDSVRLKICSECHHSLSLSDGCYVCGMIMNRLGDKNMYEGNTRIMEKEQAMDNVPYNCPYQMEMIVLGGKHENQNRVCKQ